MAPPSRTGWWLFCDKRRRMEILFWLFCNDADSSSCSSMTWRQRVEEQKNENTKCREWRRRIATLVEQAVLPISEPLFILANYGGPGLPWTCLVDGNCTSWVVAFYIDLHRRNEKLELQNLGALQTPVVVPLWYFLFNFNPEQVCDRRSNVRGTKRWNLKTCIFYTEWKCFLWANGRHSRSVCVRAIQSVSILFVVSMSFFYGVFSTCVSYLCICRLTFQSQSPYPECLDVLLPEILYRSPCIFL